MTWMIERAGGNFSNEIKPEELDPSPCLLCVHWSSAPTSLVSERWMCACACKPRTCRSRWWANIWREIATRNLLAKLLVNLTELSALNVFHEMSCKVCGIAITQKADPSAYCASSATGPVFTQLVGPTQFCIVQNWSILSVYSVISTITSRT